MQIPIERYTLDNGLRVVLSHDPALPIVALSLWFNVGSRNEVPGRTGLAHLFEHMMFQGSQNVPDTQHIALVERVGGSINASTWLDRTNYYATLPASHLELGLWLESDRLGFYLPALTQEKFDNQREVVKNERRQRIDNAPYGDWNERLQRMLYPSDHPYHHSVMGSMEDLDAATLDDVRDFFRTFYAPDNAVLTLCGDFEPGQARRLIDRYFGPIPRGPGVPPLPGRPELDPFLLGGEVRETVHSAVAVSRVHLGYRVPPYGTQDYYVADVVTELLAGGKSARLYHALVRDRRVARAVASFVLPVVTGASMMLVRGTVPPGHDPGPVEAAMLDEIHRLAAEAPTADEMERALVSLEARQVMELQKVSERADQLSMLTIYFDQPGLINTEMDAYRAVTASDVRRFVAQYLTAENRAVLTYVPHDAAPAAEAA